MKTALYTHTHGNGRKPTKYACSMNWTVSADFVAQNIQHTQRVSWYYVYEDSVTFNTQRKKKKRETRTSRQTRHQHRVCKQNITHHMCGSVCVRARVSLCVCVSLQRSMVCRKKRRRNNSRPILSATASAHAAGFRLFSAHNHIAK